ncbi:glycosyltransferase family 4 protein [Gammaproteobacteria bacterium]|nr:glycosyltransferase family 4 protein [Gammaproteobacteria bacterium]
MKICHVCAVDFTLKRLIIPLIDAQLTQGYSVKSVCSPGEHVGDLRRDGYNIETVFIARSLSPVKGLVTIWRLFCLFRRESFDVVHVHTPIAAFLGRIAAFFARVPLVVYTAHGFYFHDEMPFLKRLIFISAEVALRPLTDLLFTQSSEDASSAASLNIMNKQRIFDIGNGVDTNRFNPLVVYRIDDFDIPNDKIVIGMVSRLVQEKGIVEFLEAAKMLALDHSNVLFLLVGSRLPSDYDSSVDEAIEDANKVLGSQLVLTGEQEDIPALLANMDVFCLPSWREGMPRSIIEAMMMELPVVATNIRGSREEVVDGETGFLTPVRDVNLLHEKLEYLVNNPNIRVKMGQSGRDRAMELYDENVVIRLQLELIAKYTRNAL